MFLDMCYTIGFCKSMSYGHSGICDFVWCRDFDLQLFPDMDLFHPDFTLNTGSQTVQKHSLRSYFYSGFDKSEYLHVISNKYFWKRLSEG